MNKINIKKVNIREIKDNVNLMLFNLKNVGLKELQLSNKVCDVVCNELNDLIDQLNLKQVKQLN